AVEEIGDLPSGKELHREVRIAIIQDTEIEDLDYARMLERGERGEFGLEAEQLLRVADLVTKNFDRFVAPVRDVEDAIHAGLGRFLQGGVDLIPRRERDLRHNGLSSHGVGVRI